MSQESDKALPAIPSSWPGAFGVYKYSRPAVLLNFWPLFVFWAISFVLGSGLQFQLNNSGGDLVALLISSFASIGYTVAYIDGVRRKKTDIGAAFGKSVDLWLKMIGLTLMIGIVLLVSFLLLIVPFFIVAPRLVLANYFLVDKNMSIPEAFNASWAATKGHVAKIYGVIGANIVMLLLAFTIIGIPFSIYFLIMYSAAFAVFYEYLRKSPPAVLPEQG